MTSTVLVEVRGNVQIMTLSNPEARNAATLEMAEAMVAALDELDRNPVLQVGVITGAGSLGALLSAPLAQSLSVAHGWRTGVLGFPSYSPFGFNGRYVYARAGLNW